MGLVRWAVHGLLALVPWKRDVRGLFASDLDLRKCLRAGAGRQRARAKLTGSGNSGEEPASSDDAPSEPQPFAAVAPADHAALSDADAELAGEVPSWLEPQRRRWWRVVLAVLLVLVVLAAAAVAVVALVNA